MIKVSKNDRKKLIDGGIVFHPIPCRMTTSGFVVNNYKIYRENGKCITGLTGIDRYDVLTFQTINTLMNYRSGKQKRFGSFPCSTLAEAASFGARADAMGCLSKFSIDAVDIDEFYINHACGYKFPKGMLFGRTRWLKQAFNHTSDPDWVIAKDEIRQAINIYPPQDLRNFESGQSYDVMFVNNLFTHIGENSSLQVIENLLPQSNGLVCMAGLPQRDPREKYLPNSIREAFLDYGFKFAKPDEGHIVPSRDCSQFYKHCESAAFIAIHPELLSEMT